MKVIKVLEFKEFLKNLKSKAVIQYITEQKNDFRGLKSIYKNKDISVLKVRRKSDGKTVAFKCFRNQSFSFHELEILKMFNSERICKVYETYETQNTTYLVVEYLHACLTSQIQKNGQLRFNIPLFIKNLLKAVNLIHQKGIFHRDIKPQNIMIRQNEPVLIDFGMSTNKENSYINWCCGTPGYFSPEIIELKKKQKSSKDIEHYFNPYQKESDVFSLGCTIYEIIFRQNLFLSKEEREKENNLNLNEEQDKKILVNQLMKNNIKCEIKLNTKSFQQIHPDYQILLRGFLQKNPQKRMTIEEALRLSIFDKNQIKTNTTIKQQE